MRLRPRIRVDVLSGFLGSGKTTLLRNYLLAVDADAIAVVINEFGAISIDHRLVRRGEDNLRVLPNGCACCAVADELRSVLLGLLRDDAARSSQLVHRILIETSGLANPASILNTLRVDENLAEYLEPGCCVVTFDALVGARCAQTYPEVRSQLAAADAIVLTKADLASDDALREASAIVARINPLAMRYVAGSPTFSVAEPFLADAGIGAAAAHLPSAQAKHAPGIRSFSLRIDEDLDWASFSIWLTCLLNCHGSHILRFKGILESPSHAVPLVIHGVHHLVYPPQHLHGVTKRGYSDLVFIVDGLDPPAIEESLRAFLDFASCAA